MPSAPSFPVDRKAALRIIANETLYLPEPGEEVRLSSGASLHRAHKMNCFGYLWHVSGKHEEEIVPYLKYIPKEWKQNEKAD